MSTLAPVILQAEFGLLWLVRQLLRGIAIGIGFISAMVTLSLFAAAGVLESFIDVLNERSRLIRFSRNSINGPR